MSIEIYKSILLESIQFFAYFFAFYIFIVVPVEKKWPRSSAKMREYGFDLRFTLFLFAVSTLVLVPLTFLVRPARPVGLFSELLAPIPGWIQFLIALIIWDLAYYAFHRINHRVKMFWPLHISHHSTEEMHALAGNRANILSMIFVQVLNFIIMTFVGFSPAVAVAFPLAYIFNNTFIHLNSRLRFGFLEKIIVTPHYHLWHHVDPAIPKNYAIFFPFIDMIFGTYYLPDDPPKKLGLGAEAIPPSIWHHQVQPFFEWKWLKK